MDFAQGRYAEQMNKMTDIEKTTSAKEEFVDELLNRMTLREKIGQLNQQASTTNCTGPTYSEGQADLGHELVRAGEIGAFLNIYGRDQVRELQRLAVEETRLGIPLLFGLDVIHGYKTMFPLPIAEACSFDLDLAYRTARAAAIEASLDGVNWTFAPMVDVSREPRWGRVMEGAGEDPFLGAAMAIARVNGYQGDDLSRDDAILATLKHFAAYGWMQAGRDYTHAEIDDVTLHNMVLPPFRKAVESGAAQCVMNSFNVRNGIPATADSQLQNEILKLGWGFDGFVVSDWGSVTEMEQHGFTSNRKESAKAALSAGCDMEMATGAYIQYVEELIDEGTVSTDRVDDAVRRILGVKYELGLFSDPYQYVDHNRDEAAIKEQHRRLAVEAAEKSVVLLKNENEILPLKSQDKLAVIGSLAADKDAPLGNWRAVTEKSSAVSLLEGLDAAQITYDYARGVRIADNIPEMFEYIEFSAPDRSGFKAALDCARSADKVIMVVGEVAMMSGESRSRVHLDLSGLQQELLEAVYAVNPNIILVVMSGRPLVLDWAAENVPAILQAWHLGTESGHALTHVLTGKYNPSAKLVMTFPRSVGQVPIAYNALRTGRPDVRSDTWWSRYIDESNAPLYPFGHGLSYTRFKYSDLNVETTPHGLTAQFHVTNIGSRDGEETAQLYIRDKVSSCVRPVKELKGFKKIKLAIGETQMISLTVTHDEMGYYDRHGQLITEPGDFEVFIGGSSEHALSATVYWSAEI